MLHSLPTARFIRSTPELYAINSSNTFAGYGTAPISRVDFRFSKEVPVRIEQSIGCIMGVTTMLSSQVSDVYILKFRIARPECRHGL